MNLRPFAWLAPLALTAVALAGPALVRELRVRPDPKHLIANRLAGAWEADAALNERLGAKAYMERVEFTPDEGVLATIPAELTEKIAQERIWQAGTMRYVEKGEERRGPYLLVVFEGNPRLVVFRSRGGEALDDSESPLLTVVPTRDGAGDLLFVGGDTSREPFAAYHRVAR